MSAVEIMGFLWAGAAIIFLLVFGVKMARRRRQKMGRRWYD
jgi:hypothetical protein